MEFLITQGRHWPTVRIRSALYLKADSWDDYSYKTLYDLLFVDSDGTPIEIGPVKIMKRGMPKGRVDIAPRFSALDSEYCSLGQNQNYYEQLMSLPDQSRHDILVGLRDCVHDPKIFDEFRSEQSMVQSLLRHVSIESVSTTFRNILAGAAVPTKYQFSYTQPAATAKTEPFTLSFSVIPLSLPPTNVHVLIGRNGVGKTRLLAAFANSLTSQDSSLSNQPAGNVLFSGEAGQTERFYNLVTVAFSAFDRFAPLNQKTLKSDVRYAYVGLKQRSSSKSTGTERIQLKNPKNMADEFRNALLACQNGPRRRRWLETISILNTDPGFAALELQDIDFSDEKKIAKFMASFRDLSSGHKIVLLTATRLVELVDEKTLVLIDEPESHLHPPLLSSFVRALSTLLSNRNGVAVIASHSPVVLQEVPRSCVWILRRTGNSLSAERPRIETFGENVGTLTHEVFRLEITECGFYSILQKESRGKTYAEVLEAFGDQLGGEAKVFAHIFTKSRNGTDA